MPKLELNKDNRHANVDKESPGCHSSLYTRTGPKDRLRAGESLPQGKAHQLVG